jgi:hypothetical protein
MGMVTTKNRVVTEKLSRSAISNISWNLYGSFVCTEEGVDIYSEMNLNYIVYKFILISHLCQVLKCSGLPTTIVHAFVLDDILSLTADVPSLQIQTLYVASDHLYSPLNLNYTQPILLQLFSEHDL